MLFGVAFLRFVIGSDRWLRSALLSDIRFWEELNEESTICSNGWLSLRVFLADLRFFDAISA